MVEKTHRNDRRININNSRAPLPTVSFAKVMPDRVVAPSNLVFETRMLNDTRWALSQGGSFFEGGGDVQKTLRKITARLGELNVSYTIVGGMALFLHGFRRFTEDVDILVTGPGLKDIHKQLDGLGYIPLFPGSKNLRDIETGVKIEFLITGGFPGDGKPKPVAFPDPSDVSEERDGMRILSLPMLVELKLASGMSGADRLKDLADVQELIKVLALPANFAEQLNPYVREKYAELFRSSQRRFVRIWRNKFLTLDAQTLPGMAAMLEAAAAELKAMTEDGIFLDSSGGTADDYALMVTTDSTIAAKYAMHEESEYWEPEGDSEV